MIKNIRHTNGKFIILIGAYIITASIVYGFFVFTPTELPASYSWLRNIIIFFAYILIFKYLAYMVLGPWYDAYEANMCAKYKYPEDKLPTVSVLVPAWNEEVGILATIKSILDSDYSNKRDGKIEVVVVNDGSTDKSDDLIREFKIQYEKDNPESNSTILYRYKENGGKGMALNMAYAMSTGSIIMSIDADCTVDKKTVSNFVKYFANPKVSAAVGNVKIANTQTLIGLVQNLEFLFSFYFKKADGLLNSIYIIGGAAGAFRRSVLDQFDGPYNHTNITEDIELSMRIQDMGGKVMYAQEAIVYTEGAETLSDLLKQRLRWKKGRFETFSDYKHIFFSIKKKHSKFLSWIILPLAMVGEVHLTLEPIFILALFSYTYITHDFSSYPAGVIMVMFMFIIQVIFDKHSSKGAPRFIILLSPVVWILFYISTFVEAHSLFSAIKASIRGEKVVWQRWQRKGISDGA